MAPIFSRLFILFFLLAQPAFSSQWMAVMGDAGLIGPELTALQESISQENITSLILPGDNLYWGSYKSTWDRWKRDGFLFDVVAIGNHNGGYQKEMQYFAMPGEYYSVKKHGARFLVLNSDNTQNIEAQFAWLENEIQRVDEKLIFLVYHHPTFDAGTSHNWQTKRDFQKKMRLFLKAYQEKITALLLGHDHIGTFLNFGPTPVVIAGSSREADKAIAVDYIEEGFHIQTKFLARRTPHWVALEILDDATSANFHFIRISDQKKVCSAHYKSGRMELGANCLSRH